MSEIQYHMHPLPSIFLMELDIPTEFVDSCNDYLDELLTQDNGLVQPKALGQIKTGEQLVMDHEDPRLVIIDSYLIWALLTSAVRQSGQILDGNRNVEMDELWSVHRLRRYNPIHDHGTQTIMGISCTTWTKVPPQILQARPGSQEYGLYNVNRSGSCLCFNYGQSSTWDRECLGLLRMS